MLKSCAKNGPIRLMADDPKKQRTLPKGSIMRAAIRINVLCWTLFGTKFRTSRPETASPTSALMARVLLTSPTPVKSSPDFFAWSAWVWGASRPTQRVY